MDRMTPEQRHRCMASIRSRDTRPELIVRRFLWREGFRYRLTHRGLPGRPDLVLRRYRTVIFVNGCFWHGHADCPYYRLPRTNVDFWERKIERNRERDLSVRERLRDMGWHTIVVWECQLRPREREQTLRSLAFTLNTIFLADRRVRRPRPYSLPDADTAMAAEPLTE